MTVALEALMMKYQSTLKKIEGGHSFSIVEFNQEINSVVVNRKDGIDHLSKIAWLDLQRAYKSYNSEGIWENLSQEDVASRIIQRMQESWSFQKMFNSSKLEKFPNIESEILLIIDEMKSFLDSSMKYIVECKEMYFDYGGNDYWMIIVYLKKNIHVFEFMHFID